MKKQILFRVILLTGVLFIGITSCGTMKDREKSFVEETVGETETEKNEQATFEEDISYSERTDVVNEQIKMLLNSEAYKTAEAEERIELVSNLLNELESNGDIWNLSLNEEGNLFSFQYLDGTLGGVTIEDFSQDAGKLPMN